ncbi:MAG TPA: hypothetical protein EYP62_00855 [Kiritimatiellae bacterium]|nr:hypothetical protein [Kiritimatiellia bacterium]
MKVHHRSDSLTVYEAFSPDRVGLGAWRTMLEELWRYRELVRRLVIRGVAGQFRQSFLGYVWIALPPLAITVVFTLLRRAQVVNVPLEGYRMPYAVFALVGTTLWGLFAQVTTMATTSIANAGPLVTRIYFPREVVVLSSVGNALVNFGIRLVVVALTMLLIGFHPPLSALWALVWVVPLFAFALGLGFVFAPINTMMRDMSRILEFSFQFGMLLAPTVIATPQLVPGISRSQLALYWIHNLNPVSHFIQIIDRVIDGGPMVIDNGLAAATGIAFLVLGVGWRIFHVCEPLLAERL